MSASLHVQRELTIVVNGEPVITAAPALDALLVALGYEGQQIATALNGEFVPERDRPRAKLANGDHVEVVAPRQGG